MPIAPLGTNVNEIEIKMNLIAVRRRIVKLRCQSIDYFVDFQYVK